jgi:hypothetical protein
MSSPESNEAPTFLDKPDKFDNLNAIFCLLSIERVFEEARLFSQLRVSDGGRSKISAEITLPDEVSRDGTHARELLELNATLEDDFRRFGIKHATYVRGEDANYDLYMLRTYQLIFSDAGNGQTMALNTHFSTTSIELGQIKTDGEGVSGLFNEGLPLDTDQRETIKEMEEDVGAIKDHQFFEIKNLMTRLLDAVREQA